MKGNNRNPGQSERSGPSSRQQLRGKGHEHKPSRLTLLHVVVGVLALLLLVISAIGSLAVVNNSYAASECDLPLICPSPTPRPSRAWTVTCFTRMGHSNWQTSGGQMG